jgi:hypothetical protein
MAKENITLTDKEVEELLLEVGALEKVAQDCGVEIPEGASLGQVVGLATDRLFQLYEKNKHLSLVADTRFDVIMKLRAKVTDLQCR